MSQSPIVLSPEQWEGFQRRLRKAEMARDTYARKVSSLQRQVRENPPTVELKDEEVPAFIARAMQNTPLDLERLRVVAGLPQRGPHEPPYDLETIVQKLWDDPAPMPSRRTI